MSRQLGFVSLSFPRWGCISSILSNPLFSSLTTATAPGSHWSQPTHAPYHGLLHHTPCLPSPLGQLLWHICGIHTCATLKRGDTCVCKTPQSRCWERQMWVKCPAGWTFLTYVLYKAPQQLVWDQAPTSLSSSVSPHPTALPTVFLSLSPALPGAQPQAELTTFF